VGACAHCPVVVALLVSECVCVCPSVCLSTCSSKTATLSLSLLLLLSLLLYHAKKTTDGITIIANQCPVLSVEVCTYSRIF
jgi:hypothetical protein